jgi:predicted nucleic acid-binding protein
LGIEKLSAFLQRHSRVSIDTSIFIYHVQGNPRYLPATDRIFGWMERRGASAVTSCITLTELLVQPMQENDDDLVSEFVLLLTQYPHLEWVPASLPIAATAARFRALHRLRTPDAIQAATAIHSKATGLISNDISYRRVTDVQVFLLDDLL